MFNSDNEKVVYGEQKESGGDASSVNACRLTERSAFAKNGEAESQYTATACSLPDHELVKRAKEGDTDAQFDLGEFFFNIRNYYEAVPWLVLPAGKNHEGALRLLSDCYQFGLGTAKDENKAQIYKRKANELSDKEKNERFNPIADRQTEAALMREYNEKKDSASIINLASFFYKKGNYAQCAKWAKDGASSGVPDCTRLLAKLCEKGKGVPVDYKRAKALFLHAVEEGSAPAAEEIASRFLNGSPTFGKANKKKAAKWYAEAAKLGSKDALIKLEELNPKLYAKIKKK